MQNYTNLEELQKNCKTLTKANLQNNAKSSGNSPEFIYPYPTAETPFNKLGQLPTQEKEKWLKRARKKYATTQVVKDLLKLKTPLKKQYERAKDCSIFLSFEDGKVKTRLCRTRICVYCNNIRTANLINGYDSELGNKINQGKAYFITLTRKNVKAEFLRATIKKMNSDLANMVRVFNEKRKWNISGIRAQETTYNHKRNDYHPHIHIIAYFDNEAPENWEKLFLKEWETRHNSGEVNKKGQNIKPATRGSLKELFKYVSKMANKKKDKNDFDKKEKKHEVEYYPEALDIILRAYYKTRVIQNFGKLRKVKEDLSKNITEPTLIETRYKEFAIWKGNDWLYYTNESNTDNFFLSGYQPKTIWKPLKIEPPG